MTIIYIIKIAVITTNPLPPSLKQMSTLTDTVLLFKEEKTPLAVIRDVSE